MKGCFRWSFCVTGWLDGAIKAARAGAGVPGLAAGDAAVVLLGLLALLLAVRFRGLAAGLGFTRIDLAVMFLGYLAIVAQLLVGAPACSRGAWVGSVSVHLFTFGVMGLIIPAMFVASQGPHRPAGGVRCGDKLVLWIMLAALVLHVVPRCQLLPAAYGRWVHLSAGRGCWPSASSACACCRVSSPAHRRQGAFPASCRAPDPDQGGRPPV